MNPPKKNPSKFHGIGPYDIATGEVKKGLKLRPEVHERILEGYCR